MFNELSTQTLLAAERMPLHFLNKLVVDCATQAFLKLNMSNKACLWNFLRLEVSIRANKFAYRTFLRGLSWKFLLQKFQKSSYSIMHKIFYRFSKWQFLFFS